MSRDIVIQAEKVSKLYHLGSIGSGTLSGDISRSFSRLFGKEVERNIIDENKNDKQDTLWALKDVSFEVKKGDVLGIIGKNGAGKSTLLKILSQITKPTSGEVRIKGRVASLLEVGTGFHPELTGRENIFLNGAIFGLKKNEIKKKFDEIVDFSGVEKYIDTPVKRYSSGMYVRLAFAVAAHLEPEILIVDEVLAVGDMAFQNKCIGRISQVSGEGSTCLIVSHNMDSIARLCKQAILLKDGEISMQGDPTEIIKGYLSDGNVLSSEKIWSNVSDAPGNKKVRLQSIRLLDDDRNLKVVFDIRYEVLVEYEYEIFEPLVNIIVAFQLINSSDVVVFTSFDTNYIDKNQAIVPGRYKAFCKIPGNLLSEDRFFVRATMRSLDKDSHNEIHVDLRNAVSFQVVDKMEGGSAREKHTGGYAGVIRPILTWATNKI